MVRWECLCCARVDAVGPHVQSLSCIVKHRDRNREYTHIKPKLGMNDVRDIFVMSFSMLSLSKFGR